MRLSFEFFPPKTDEQRQQLDAAVAALKPRNPEYVSCTFGAGGSTLSYTFETVTRLRDVHGLEAAPHVSCVGGSRPEIAALLAQYREAGIRRVVALRGDLPSGMATLGEFRYASDLVRFIRAEHGDWFHVEVAGYPEIHPQAESAESDVRAFVNKVRCGADGAITQYFFNADAYFRFVDEIRGLGCAVPIVPGIMPISNYSQLKRFSDICGAEIPRWIAKRCQSFGDDAQAIREFGADVVAALCRRLREGGVESFHFYTLNRARATEAVLERIG
jgi:methylenetetrahydrofolate reductase (NADPH)